MKNHTSYRDVFPVLLVAAFALTGCSKHSTPPKQQVQEAVAAVLPPYLSLVSIELEPISTGPESVKVNCKAVVAPKEDLYQVEREVEGTPKVTLIKMVQAAGTKVSLYGFVEARRFMDKWTLDSPQIQIGPDQFGNPRGTFNAQSYVAGSEEANAALSQQSINAEHQRQARKAALEQDERERKAREEAQARADKAREERQAREDKARREREEQARIAFEEQRQKEIEQRKKDDEQRKAEEEAAHQKLILATVPGKSYIGTAAHQDRVKHVSLVFTEQKNLMIRAEVTDLDDSKQKITFIGELRFNPQPEHDGSTGYSIVMSSIGNCTWLDFHEFGLGTMQLKLRLADKGLEGDARHEPTIHLQREGASQRR